MNHTITGLARVVAIALLASVATQIFYIAVVAEIDGDTVLRPVTWMTEMAIFSLVAVAAMPLVARSSMPLAAAAIVLAGILNAVQVGMGLSMFGPSREAADGQVFATVLQGAFFFFFQAKALLGVAAIGVGIAAIRGSLLGKVIGGIAILSGFAAAILNLLAMAQGMEDWTFPAGAAGTVATALLALALFFAPRNNDG